MIVLPAPPLAASAVAFRAAGAGFPFWLATPGEGDVEVVRFFVGCAPHTVVRGASVDAVEEAWRAARGGWGDRLGVPVGVGHFSYDLGRSFETFRDVGKPASSWPDLEFRFYDALWTQDARTGVAEIWARDAAAARRLLEKISDGGRPVPEPVMTGLGSFASVDPPCDHVHGVGRVLEYLRAGDVYQVNLARRLEASLETPGEPPGWSLFANLLRESPAPHALWLADLDAQTALVGNSPERFLRVQSGTVETRPIKGTRPRVGGDLDRGAEELVASAKDRAEHIMIVDLERNDLGRICVTGSVEVTDFARPITLPTVHHLVSTVRGRLRPDWSLRTLLAATFPSGSVTGAPKIRAMEIIDELETARRGPYTGATGWLGAAGDLDLAVAIRTGLLRRNRLTCWVGGGIVADSDPEEELRETEIKAEAFTRLARRSPSDDGSPGGKERS